MAVGSYLLKAPAEELALWRAAAAADRLSLAAWLRAAASAACEAHPPVGPYVSTGTARATIELPRDEARGAGLGLSEAGEILGAAVPAMRAVTEEPPSILLAELGKKPAEPGPVTAAFARLSSTETIRTGSTPRRQRSRTCHHRIPADAHCKLCD